MSEFDSNNKPFCPFTNPHGKREPNPALEKIATLANMYSEEELRNETDEERPLRDAAALAIIDEILDLNASATASAIRCAVAEEASYQQRLQEKEKEQIRIRLMMQEQEQKKLLERHRNPHKVESKKYWRWEQYGDDSDRDCKTCGERVGFASWAHCSDRCLIDDVGFETYQEAMKSGNMRMRKLRIRPGWKSEFEKEVALSKEEEGDSDADEELLRRKSQRNVVDVCGGCQEVLSEQRWLCSVCKLQHYCSGGCQHKHWPEHNKVCNRLDS